MVILGIVGSICSLSISIPFAIIYGIQFSKFDSLCIATNETLTEDVSKNFKFVMQFGFGNYLAKSLLALIAFFSGYNRVIGYVNALLSFLISVPTLLQTIYLGYYRYCWSGKACAAIGAPLE